MFREFLLRICCQYISLLQYFFWYLLWLYVFLFVGLGVEVASIKTIVLDFESIFTTERIE